MLKSAGAQSRSWVQKNRGVEICRPWACSLQTWSSRHFISPYRAVLELSCDVLFWKQLVLHEHERATHQLWRPLCVCRGQQAPLSRHAWSFSGGHRCHCHPADTRSKTSIRRILFFLIAFRGIFACTIGRITPIFIRLLKTDLTEKW